MSFRMSVPSHWRTELLGDLCDKITDGTHHSPSEDDQTPRGEFAYVTAKNIKEGGIDLSRITYLPARIHNPIFERCNPERGDVLYIKDGATTGIATVNQLDEPFSMLSSVALLKPKRSVLEPRFLKWYLNSPIGYSAMTSQMTGTAIKRLTLTKIKEAWAPVAPLPEQRRIVAKIEELFSDLDAGVAALKRVRANLNRYRAAVLKAAVDGRLTEEWRTRYPATEPAAKLLERILAERRAKWEQDQLRKFKEAEKTPPKGWKEKYEEPPEPADLPADDLPDRWAWATLLQLGSVDRGRSRHRPRDAAHLYGGPYPFVQTGDIGRANTFIRSYTQTYSEAGLAQSRLWPRGTLCITIAANIAETAILDIDACFPDSVVGFAPAGDGVSVRYVELHFRTVQKNLERWAPATAQKNINVETLTHLPVRFPPTAEQAEIVAEVDRRLSVADAAETLVEHALQRAARLRQAILKRAFEGNLVTQDPSDQPAGSLLERIKTESKGHGEVRGSNEIGAPKPTKRRSTAHA